MERNEHSSHHLSKKYYQQSKNVEKIITSLSFFITGKVYSGFFKQNWKQINISSWHSTNCPVEKNPLPQVWNILTNVTKSSKRRNWIFFFRSFIVSLIKKYFNISLLCFQETRSLNWDYIYFDFHYSLLSFYCIIFYVLWIS